MASESNFTAVVNTVGDFTATVNGSAVFNATVEDTGSFYAGIATVGPSGVVAADFPLTYDSQNLRVGITPDYYATLSYVNGTFQPSAGMSAYLTVSDAQATYYPVTNPAGYITNSALAPYLLSATAADTYQTLAGMSSYATVQSVTDGLATKQPVGDYATNTALTDGLATKQPVGDYATNTALTDGLATKQPVGDYATNTALTSGLATKQPVGDYATNSALNEGLATKQPVGDYATNSSLNAVESDLQGQIDGKQPVGDYATNTDLTNGLATKQPVGDYATNTALADGLATKANTVHTHTIQQVDGLETELSGKQPVGDYATNTALTDGLATKANLVHTHDAADIVSGVIDISRIPVIPSQVQVFAEEPDITQLTQAEQDQITGAGVIVVLTNGERWMYKGTGSKTDYDSYVKIGDITPDWSDITNKPSTFTPSAHTHLISDVDGLQTALDGKNPLLDQSLNTTDSVSFANVTTSSITILDGDNDLIIDESGILFTDGTLQSTAGVSPSYLSGELTNYLTVYNASATYQTLSGMSDYLTTAAAAATYYPLSNPAGYITSAALTGLPTLAGANAFTGANTFTISSGSSVPVTITNNGTGDSFRVNDVAGDTNPFVINQFGYVGIGVASPAVGCEINGNTRIWGSSASLPTLEVQNTGTSSSQAALKIENRGLGYSLLIHDQQSPDSSPFVVDASGNVGVKTGSPAYDLDVNGTARVGTLRFTDGTSQTTAWSSSALSGYATESWVTTNFAPAGWNPFNQTLNTNDYVTLGGVLAYSLHATNNGSSFPISSIMGAWSFDTNTGFWVDTQGSVFIGADASYSQLKFTGANITFPDGTVQSTAWSGSYSPFDQSLNTIDIPTFYGLTTNGGNVTLNDNQSPSVYQFKWDASTAIAGVYAGAIPIVELTSNGITLGSIGASLTFSDGTIQTTAATTPDLTPYAEKAASNTFTENQVIEVADNSNAALRITQTGTGEALRVEDSANPDSTPFIVTADGRVGVGTTSVGTNSLTVVGNVQFTGLATIGNGINASAPAIITSTGTSVPLTIQNNGTSNSFVVNDEASDTSPFVIQADGTVCIGSTSPIVAGYKLSVTGPIVSVNGAAQLYHGSAGLSLIQTGGTFDAFKVENRGTGASMIVRDEQNDITPFIVDGAGNVGIKTATPSTDFEVAGSAIISGSVSSGTSVIVSSPSSVFGSVGIEPDGVRFNDGTLQTTAATGYNQSLNNTDTVTFASVSAYDGTNLSQVTPTSISSTAPDGKYIAIGPSLGLYIYDPSVSASAFGVTSGGVSFADGTLQTTAAVSYNQSLNTADGVTFSGVSVVASGNPPTTLSTSATEGGDILGWTTGSGFTLKRFRVRPNEMSWANYTNSTSWNVNEYQFSAYSASGTVDVYSGEGIYFYSNITGNQWAFDENGVYFADGTLQTTAATSYDQSLNVSSDVTFNSASIGSGALDFISIASGSITFPDSSIQQKAYPFIGAVATAIEGGLLNANSPSANNAFATLGDVESSVNAYAASVTPVLPTADQKAALAAAESPSASNQFVTESAMEAYVPQASDTTSGKVELATKAEAVAGTSTTLAVTPDALTGVRVDIQTFGSPTTSGTFTWTKPAGAKLVIVRAFGAGGGGSSGRCDLTTNARSGGGGGAGGASSMFMIPASDLPDNVTVVVGGGGIGGIGNAVTGSGPLSGGGGGNTTFGNYLTIRGAGGNGASGSGAFTGVLFNIAGSLASGSGANGTTTTGGTGGGTASGYFVPLGGGGGGGAAAGSTTSAAGGNGGSRTNGITPAAYTVSLAGGAGGTTAGVEATDGTNQDVSYAGGAGGGGGYYVSGQNGGQGGNGGWPSGGGGGGGAANAGFTSGSGGKGGNGLVIVTTYF